MPLRILEDKGWRTPNSYSNTFASLPSGPGVYALIRPAIVKDSSTGSGRNIVLEVLYIGMSTNLSRRFLNHAIKRAFDKKGEYVQIWFKPCPKHQLRVRERNLIQKYDPPFNIIHRVRGEL